MPHTHTHNIPTTVRTLTPVEASCQPLMAKKDFKGCEHRLLGSAADACRNADISIRCSAEPRHPRSHKQQLTGLRELRGYDEEDQRSTGHKVQGRGLATQSTGEVGVCSTCTSGSTDGPGGGKEEDALNVLRVGFRLELEEAAADVVAASLLGVGAAPYSHQLAHRCKNNSSSTARNTK